MNIACALGLGALLILVGSCAPSPVKLAPDFGHSVKSAIDSQRLHPESPANLDPVEGLDGRAANTAIERYWATFEEAEPAAEKGALTSSSPG